MQRSNDPNPVGEGMLWMGGRVGVVSNPAVF